MRVKREDERKKMIKFRVPWQFCIAENYQKLPSRDPLEYKSKLVRSLTAITFIRSRCSRSQLERLILQQLILKEISVRSDSEYLGNSNSVQQKMIRNCNSGILQSTKVKLLKSFAAINFVRSRYSRSQSMEHLKEISQKPHMHPFGADSSL